eukprot:7385965-Prymnesium_polylepis.1
MPPGVDLTCNRICDCCPRSASAESRAASARPQGSPGEPTETQIRRAVLRASARVGHAARAPVAAGVAQPSAMCTVFSALERTLMTERARVDCAWRRGRERPASRVAGGGRTRGRTGRSHSLCRLGLCPVPTVLVAAATAGPDSRRTPGGALRLRPPGLCTQHTTDSSVAPAALCMLSHARHT